MINMTKYKSCRIINGKPRWIIVDDNGDIINAHPSREELKNLEEEHYVYGIIEVKQTMNY